MMVSSGCVRDVVGMQVMVLGSSAWVLVRRYCFTRRSLNFRPHTGPLSVPFRDNQSLRNGKR